MKATESQRLAACRIFRASRLIAFPSKYTQHKAGGNGSFWLGIANQSSE
jgi:hypothetical protein